MFFSFPLGTEMFYFPRCAVPSFNGTNFAYREIGFPHSEIPGSKVGSHLPEAYRKHPTSFIASISQGIHHLLLIITLASN